MLVLLGMVYITHHETTAHVVRSANTIVLVTIFAEAEKYRVDDHLQKKACVKLK